MVISVSWLALPRINCDAVALFLSVFLMSGPHGYIADRKLS